MDRLKILRTHAEEMRALSVHMRGQNLEIIEAGCGRRWHPELANPTARITGVDCDEPALALRTDLAQAILGDVCTIDLPEAKADIVYNAYVLEHVRGAEQALENFFRWLKPGGLLILRIPDRYSVYGFVTRVTPHSFHVFYKRWIVGHKKAGQPGFGPYPTFHEPIVSRHGIHAFCAQRDYEIVEEFGVALHARKARLLMTPACIALWLLSFGQLAWRHCNLHYVIRKRAA